MKIDTTGCSIGLSSAKVKINLLQQNMEGIPRSIRFYPDIYASLIKELERRRANGDKEIDFTKLVNELCLIMPVDAWGDLSDRVANLESQVNEIKLRLT